MTSLADHATQVAYTLSAPVFPVRVQPDPERPGKTTKQPLVREWQNGGARREPEGIRQLFTHRPLATHVGVQTGGALLVIDADSPDAEQYLQDNPDLFPPTRRQQTRRGMHHFYQKPRDVRISSTTATLHPGIDIRAEGGFICDWSTEFEPVGEIVAAPQALLDRLTEVREVREDTPTESVDHPPLSLDELDEILGRISADSYDDWIKVGQALKKDYGGESFARWVEWSKTSAKFNSEDDCRKHWQSFKKSGPGTVGTGTLIHMAGGRFPRTEPAEDFELPPPSILARFGDIAFRHIADIVAEKREPSWLIYDVIEANVLAVIAGPRGTFKSFIALHWAMRIATSGGGVVILSGEGAGLDRRVDAWMRTYEPELELSSVPILAMEYVVNLNDDIVVSNVGRAIKACGFTIKLIVVDTLSKYASGVEENSNQEMARYLSRLAVKLRDALQVTVLLVAHTGHSDASRPRGAYALMANPDAEYIVNRPDKTGMEVAVTRERFKDTPSLPPLGYKAELVDLGRVDSYLKPVTSLVLRETDEPPVMRREPQGAKQKHVLQVARSLLALGTGEVSREALVTEVVRGFNVPPDGRDNRRREAIRVISELIDKGFLRLDAGQVKLG